MYETSQTIGSSLPGEVGVADQHRSRIERGGCTLVQGPVGPVGVVMLDLLGKDCFEVPAPEDEHPVEALAPGGADHALIDGVGPRLSGPGVFI